MRLSGHVTKAGQCFVSWPRCALPVWIDAPIIWTIRLDRLRAAQIIRELLPPVAKWVSNNRITMSLLSNGTVIIIVWSQLCSAHERLFQQPFQDIVIIIIGAVLLHFAFVIINWPIVK